MSFSNETSLAAAPGYPPAFELSHDIRKPAKPYAETILQDNTVLGVWELEDGRFAFSAGSSLDSYGETATIKAAWTTFYSLANEYSMALVAFLPKGLET